MTDRSLPDPRPRSAAAWRRRIALLAADLLLFDPARLDWLRALRTVAALLLPLLLSHLLEMPLLAWAGVGAFLLAVGDSVDDGDRRQVPRLLLATLLGSLALASGVVASQSLALALPAAFAWGLAVALLGAWGPAFATMGLPIAWAFVEMGLPAGRDGTGQPWLLAGLFMLGGGLTLALTLVQHLILPSRPLHESCAACFRNLADYLERRRMPDGSLPVPSPETRVRAAIQEARRLAAETRPDRGGRVQRLAALVESADRMFAVAAALPAGSRAYGASLAAAVRAMARAVARPGRPLPADWPEAGAGPDAPPLGDALQARLAAELAAAARLLRGGDPGAAAPLPAPPPPAGALLQPLRDCLHRDSLVGRHALRFATLLAIAVALYWVFPSRFGYWIPLTVTVVLKPYAGLTLSRTVQRCLGTGAGILAGSLLMPLLPDAVAQFAVVAAAFFCLMAVLPFNYSLAIFFLSLGLIPFEHLLMPTLERDVALMRLAATGIGATLAVVGGHLLWPSFEHRALPDLLRASLRSMAGYAGIALRLAQGQEEARPELAGSRRSAGLDTTNLQAGIAHAAVEPGFDPRRLAAAVEAAGALQRVANLLNGFAHAGPAPAAEAEILARWQPAVMRELEALAAGAADAHPGLPPPAGAPAGLQQLAAELAILRQTVPHCS